ncbi:MAG: 50S ribosomal protein L21 [Candidatus Peregrinibacteria bacterium]
MFAVVSIAGFQEKVSEGDTLKVALLPGNVGDSVSFSQVYLLQKSDADIAIGMPLVNGASVEAKILQHGKHDKIIGAKLRRRKRSRSLFGHRQDFTEIEIVKIVA